jgi:hypothetical protein
MVFEKHYMFKARFPKNMYLESNGPSFLKAHLIAKIIKSDIFVRRVNSINCQIV